MVDRDGRILREAGSPPDDYNPDGQRWSSPTYRWSRHFETNFDWWKKRMTKTIERFDTVRLDHFIGFYNYYAFPGVDARPQDDALWREEREKARQYATHPDDDYEDGWTPGPQEKFFDAIFEVAPREALVAEDLGVMNQGVRDLRDSLDLPGMRVLQFSFDSVAPGAPDPTREWPLRSVAYTGTHDGAPIVGWIDDVRRYGKRFWKTLDFDAVRDVLMRHKRPYDLPAPSRPTSLLARLRDLFRKDRPILGIAQYDRPAPLTVLERLGAIVPRRLPDSRRPRTPQLFENQLSRSQRPRVGMAIAAGAPLPRRRRLPREDHDGDGSRAKMTPPRFDDLSFKKNGARH